MLTIVEKIEELGYKTETYAGYKPVLFAKEYLGHSLYIKITTKGNVDFEECCVKPSRIYSNYDLLVLQKAFDEFEANLKELLKFLLGSEVNE